MCTGWVPGLFKNGVCGCDLDVENPYLEVGPSKAASIRRCLWVHVLYLLVVNLALGSWRNPVCLPKSTSAGSPVYVACLT